MPTGRDQVARGSPSGVQEGEIAFTLTDTNPTANMDYGTLVTFCIDEIKYLSVPYELMEDDIPGMTLSAFEWKS